MHEFRKCVQRYEGNYKVKAFPVLINFSVWHLLN